MYVKSVWVIGTDCTVMCKKQVRVCVMQGLCIHLHPRTLHQIYLDL